jgi:DnaJ-class molecular chaperone
MARDSGEGGDPGADLEDGAEASHEPRECMPCRGTGQVISNLGGTPKRVSCPWCGGSGIRATGIDAQARWMQDGAEQAGGEPSVAEEPPEPAA